MLAQMKQAAHLSAWSPFLPVSGLEPAGYVYVEDECVVGNLSLRYALPHSSRGRLIGNVVVQPAHRGKGIGRTLVKTAIEAARSQGARWIGLEVRADNAIACDLYKSLGFSAVGQTRHLLRSKGIPWPECTPPRQLWRPSYPRDRAFWNELACAIYGRQQRRVLEVRPNLYAFGGLGRWLTLWLSHQRERAWFHRHETPRLALRVETERHYHFHVWDVLLHPDEGETGAQEIVAMALKAARYLPTWPVIALVADQPFLLQALHGIGFRTHRTLLQMILEL